jgi:FtsP/CotA-like multicopper oxidase with cupredoxin domain
MWTAHCDVVVAGSHLLGGRAVDRWDELRLDRYLMHCHQLEHEDSGMMMNFEVT